MNLEEFKTILNKHLESFSYIGGHIPCEEDLILSSQLKDLVFPNPSHVNRWLQHIFNRYPSCRTSKNSLSFETIQNKVLSKVNATAILIRVGSMFLVVNK